jgi:hypothetical protein
MVCAHLRTILNSAADIEVVDAARMERRRSRQFSGTGPMSS